MTDSKRLRSLRWCQCLGATAERIMMRMFDEFQTPLDILRACLSTKQVHLSSFPPTPLLLYSLVFRQRSSVQLKNSDHSMQLPPDTYESTSDGPCKKLVKLKSSSPTSTSSILKSLKATLDVMLSRIPRPKLLPWPRRFIKMTSPQPASSRQWSAAS